MKLLASEVSKGSTTILEEILGFNCVEFYYGDHPIRFLMKILIEVLADVPLDSCLKVISGRK